MVVSQFEIQTVGQIAARAGLSLRAIDSGLLCSHLANNRVN